MTQKELIRQEIERLKKILEESNYYLDNSEQALGYSLALNDFKEFIDSLPEEKTSEDLEEAAEEYASDYPAWNDEQVIAKYAFKRGAEWQKKQMELYGIVTLTESEFDAEKEKASEWGYNLYKEQMMKDAVEAKIYGYDDGSFELVASWLDMPKNSIYKDGDKVKIIIVKQDDKQRN